MEQGCVHGARGDLGRVCPFDLISGTMQESPFTGDGSAGTTAMEATQETMKHYL